MGIEPYKSLKLHRSSPCGLSFCSCPDYCHICEDFYGCTQCIYSYYLEISTNITSGNTSTICYQCPNNCTTCQDYNGCTQCNDAFYLQIAINSTNNITQTFCYPCPQNCTQCDNYNTCTQCKNKFYLENRTNMTAGVDDIVCSPCAYECSLCQREDYCTECISKYYELVDDFCVDLCGDSYVIDVECDRGMHGGYGCNADCTVKDQYQSLTFDHQSFCEYVGSIHVDMDSIEKAYFQNMMEVQLTIKPQLEQYYQVTGSGNMTTDSSGQGSVGGAEFDKMFSYTCQQKDSRAQLTYDQEGGITVLIEFEEDMQDQSFLISYHSYHGLANHTWEFVASTHPLQLLAYSAGYNQYAKFLFYFGYALVGLGWLICVAGVMAPSRLAGLEFIFLLQYCFVTLLWMEDYLYLPFYSLRPLFYSTGYYHTFSTAGNHDYPPQALIFQLPHQTLPFNLMGFLWVVPFIIIIINAIRYSRSNGDESRLALLLQLQKSIEVFFYVTMFNLTSFTNACVVYYSEGDMSDQASQAIVGVCGFAVFVSWVAFVIWQPSFGRFRFAFRVGCLSFYHYCLLGLLLVGSVLLIGLVPQYGWLPLIPQLCMVLYLAISRPYNVTFENARAIFYALIMCTTTTMKIYWSFDPHSHRSTNSYIFPGAIEGLLFLALLWAFFSVIYDYACTYCFSETPQKQRIYDLLDEKQTLQKIKNTMFHSSLLTKEPPVTTYQQQKSNESQHQEHFSEKLKWACKTEVARSPTALKVLKEELNFLKFQTIMNKKYLFSQPVQIETLKDYDAI